jgi:hypothetical protein
MTSKSKIESNTSLKDFLREECITSLAGKHVYFNIDAVRAYLNLQGRKTQGATLKSYLSELTTSSFLYNAGKGWYTFVKEPFKLDLEPVSELTHLIEKKYPLLDFSCWSTAQIRAYMHHLLDRFASFVYVEQDAMPSVSEFLRDQGYDVWNNPRAKTAEGFAIRNRTVVIRRTIKRQPENGHFAPIEKILVDLFIENRSLPMMELEEYARLFKNISEKERISIGTFLSYAKECNLTGKDFRKALEFTISDNL